MEMRLSYFMCQITQLFIIQDPLASLGLLPNSCTHKQQLWALAVLSEAFLAQAGRF